MTIAWCKDLETGVPLVDTQHRELIRRVNAYLDAAREGRGGEVLADTFCFLDSYVRSHFADEEALMRRHAYPGLAGHRQAHRALEAKLAEVRERIAGGEPNLLALLETNQLLAGWLTNHILHHDRRFATWLQRAAA